MNTQKTVFEKISKLTPKEVELSEVERVEFAIKDYDAFLDLIVAESSKIKKQIGKLGTVANDLQQLNKIAGQASVDAANALSKAEAQLKQDLKAAADLGVDDSEIKRKFQFLKNQEAELQKLASRMTRAASSALKAIQ